VETQPLLPNYHVKAVDLISSGLFQPIIYSSEHTAASQSIINSYMIAISAHYLVKAGKTRLKLRSFTSSSLYKITEKCDVNSEFKVIIREGYYDLRD